MGTAKGEMEEIRGGGQTEESREIEKVEIHWWRDGEKQTGEETGNETNGKDRRLNRKGEIEEERKRGEAEYR